jgi:hypothetical protein
MGEKTKIIREFSTTKKICDDNDKHFFIFAAYYSVTKSSTSKKF